MAESPKLLTVEEKALQLKIHPQSLYRLIRQGKMEHFKVGGKIMFDEFTGLRKQLRAKAQKSISPQLQKDIHKYLVQTYLKEALEKAKGDSTMIALPTARRLNLGLCGYFPRKYKKSGREVWAIWYLDPKSAKRVEVVLKGVTNQQEAYLFMEKKRLEIISQMLEFDSSYSIPTAHNGGSPEVELDEKGRISFGVFAEKFKEVYLSQRTKGTRLTQSSIIDKHLVPYFKKYNLSEIFKQQIDEYFASKNLNENIKKLHYSILHSIFKRAVEWMYLKTDPFRFYNKDNKPFKIADKAGTVIIDEEFKRILSKADYHLVPILKCLWMTGMRKKEALTLQWDDVNFEKNHILIRAEVAKSSKYRYIPISKELRKILKGLEKKSNFVFTYGKKGTPIKEIHGSWSSAVRRAGIKRKIRIHDIRHTFGTKLIKNNDAETVRKILGHADLSMTQKYIHSSSKDAQEAIDKTFNGKGK